MSRNAQLLCKLFGLLPQNFGLFREVLRRTKEEMRTPDGDALYPDRIIETLDFRLSHQEGHLQEQVLKYVRERYGQAKKANSFPIAERFIFLFLLLIIRKAALATLCFDWDSLSGFACTAISDPSGLMTVLSGSSCTNPTKRIPR